ncbi:MAG: hypothetical protein HC830_05370 [Bacteroidetes bacterium]|nr:hypothetical protein [Bacteroidota bacterium]
MDCETSRLRVEIVLEEVSLETAIEPSDVKIRVLILRSVALIPEFSIVVATLTFAFAEVTSYAVIKTPQGAICTGFTDIS